MTPDELLTHLEAELARCRDERDRLSAELEAARAELDEARRDGLHWDRTLLKLQADLDEAEEMRDWLYGELAVGARLEELAADAPAARPARLGSPGGHGTPLSDARGNRRSRARSC